MKIAIGADHGGIELKSRLIAVLRRKDIGFDDAGSFDSRPVDYPDFARAVARQVASGAADQGILICRTGIGMSIAANRYPQVRAALCLGAEMARTARRHNNANVLVLAGDVTDPATAEAILETWLATSFENAERHRRRVDKLGCSPGGIDDIASIAALDPEMAAAIRNEVGREAVSINLIASENYASRAVREAQGSVLTNKYAEGYPDKRWYNGCEFVDAAERLALDRAHKLFGADHANVQPHCGSSANMAVYFAALQPGDTILAMSLAHGGHLTHGHKLNFSGRLFTIVPYGVSRATETIDYDEVARLAAAQRPKLIVAGASAYPRIIDFPRLRAIADSVGAMLMVDMAHIAGLVAANCHPSPVPHADFVTSTTHKTLRGPRSGMVLCRAKFAQDLDRQVFPGLQGGPLMHTIAAKAVCFLEALQPGFAQYQAQVVANARHLAGFLAAEGLRIISGGTDNHLMLVDVTPAGATGRDVAAALEKAGITVNKNAIPFDPHPPAITSGIRIGTPAVTTRGMKEPEMEQIGKWIIETIRRRTDAAALGAIRKAVADLCARHPIP